MGKSLVEEEALPEAKRLLDQAPEQFILPVDVIVAKSFSADALGNEKPVGYITRRRNGAGHWPGDVGDVRRRAGRREVGRLERTDGRVRVRRIR